MMHVYLCLKCKKAYFISRRKQASCQCCKGRMVCSTVDFNEWIEMNEGQRTEFINNLAIHC